VVILKKVDLLKFGFIEREKVKGKYLKNRCGRDFLYYVLNYYFPSKYNPTNKNPEQIEKEGIFGLKLPTALIWTTLTFLKVPKLFKKHGLKLIINELEIKSYIDFIHSMFMPAKVNFRKANRVICSCIHQGKAVGIDLSLGLFGLKDHIMFVYGYDDDNFYVFDSHKVKKLRYTKTTKDSRFIMKLPKSEIKRRWRRFSRVWVVEQLRDR